MARDSQQSLSSRYDEENKDNELEKQSNQFNQNSHDQLELEDHIKFRYIAGIINTDDVFKFKRLVFRVTRGAVFTQTILIEESENEEEQFFLKSFKDVQAESKGIIMSKTVFMIMFSG